MESREPSTKAGLFSRIALVLHAGYRLLKGLFGWLCQGRQALISEC